MKETTEIFWDLENKGNKKNFVNCVNKQAYSIKIASVTDF